MRFPPHRLPIGTCALAALALASCTAVPTPAPQPSPQPAPRPGATPAPAPAPQAAAPVRADPMAGAQTPGDWRWRRAGADSIADFTSPDGRLLLQMACTAQRQVLLTVTGARAGTVTVGTETLARVVQATGGTVGATMAFDARDPLLDAMAFSRGRFSIQAGGMAELLPPSYPEITRVIEDCR